MRAAFDDNRLDFTILFKRRGERRERRLSKRGRDVLQLHPETQVRLVAPEAAHRLSVSQTPERRFQLRADQTKNANEQAFDQTIDLLARGEAELDIELRELRLPIRAQVFVAEAARDLVIL